MFKRKFVSRGVTLAFLLAVSLFLFASVSFAAGQNGSIDGVSIELYDDNSGVPGNAITAKDLTAGKLFWAKVFVNNPVKLRMIDLMLEYDKEVLSAQNSKIIKGSYYQYADSNLFDANYDPLIVSTVFTSNAAVANASGAIKYNPGVKGDTLPDIPAEYLTGNKLELLSVQFKVATSIPHDGYIRWIRASADDLAGKLLIGTGESGNEIPFPTAAPIITIKKPVPVTAITVSGEAYADSITANGGTLQMYADVLPANADNTTVTWSVTALDGTATTKATISSTGLLTAAGNASANGDVLVKATANDGSGIYGTKTIHISGQIDLVTSITVTGQNNVSAITTSGGTLQMLATVLPATANQTVIWAVYAANGTDSTTIATIDTNGLLTASGLAGNNGDVVVKAKAIDGSGVSGTKTINISNQTGPALAELRIVGTLPTSLVVGQSIDLSTVAQVYGRYSNSTEFVPLTTGFTWVSSNTAAASVSGSIVTAISKGTADIYVQSGSVSSSKTTVSVEYPLSVDFTAQDLNGNQVTTFAAGGTYNFVAKINGTLATADNVLLIVQMKDNNGVVYNIGSMLDKNATSYNNKELSAGFKLPATAGTYTAEAFIWNKWPSQSGTQWIWAQKQTLQVNVQ
ncbi:Ig-like domain-containing protein [Pelotomaculum isophthalicicum JI]|uniref:Ig-like domain-containing protein n=1 Tax=Pelotomaculum isophthalicicum JI TaxID=947010 RepID=A0A9X4GXG0_9FIRM|nr:Ig-like domain-containing protein [Pelotomaculum isophthalicicum]MDF9406770.1 Ig-like domain-containing protein [Pelotomaculum isophthalicicum JI]